MGGSSSSSSSSSLSTSTSSSALVGRPWVSDEGMFYDCAFTVEGSTVKCHRAVLSARCQYFRTMFSGPWREVAPSSTTIPLPDVSLAAFLAVLRHLYSDALPPPAVLDTYALPILAESQRLGLERLSAAVQAHCASYLSPDVAPVLLDVADTLGAVQLRARCLAFCARHYARV